MTVLRHAVSHIMASATRVPIPRRGVDYRGKVVLAPMVRSGECPSRLMALRYGADLVWGPETVDKALIGTTRRVNPTTNTIDFSRVSSNAANNPALPLEQRESVIFRLHPDRERGRLIYQIGTANPETAVEAAKLIAPDVAGIDVNAGCPKPFSTSGGMGAALLKTPDRLCAILRALVKDVGEPNEIGISVKIRLLDKPEDTASLVSQLCATGITGLTVHCRTTPMRPRERAIRGQLRMVADVCREAGVACLMNGDVMSRDEAQDLVSEYGVDGAMIATAAETNPSVFRPKTEGGSVTWEEAVKQYVITSMEVENRFGNTKYLLGQMIPGKQPAYKATMATSSYTGVVRALGHAEELGQRAREVDKKLLLGEFERPKMTKAQLKAARKAAAQAATETSQELDDGSRKAAILPRAVKRLKRTAEIAELNMPPDVSRDSAPGSISEQTSALAV